MAVPGVNFTISPTQTQTPHTVDDVVFVIGEIGTGGNGVVGELYQGNSLSELEDAVGTDGDTHDFIDDVFAHITPHIHFTPVAAGAGGLALAAAMDLAYEVDPIPTVLHGAGSLTAPGNATIANTLVNEMETIAETINCRGVANAAQDTVANGILWGQNNGKPRIIGVFNQEVSDPTTVPLGPGVNTFVDDAARDAYFITTAGAVALAFYDANTALYILVGGTNLQNRVTGAWVAAIHYRMPAGAWLGAALAVSEEHGRAWGINLARVLGHLNIRHPLTAYSSQLVNLDAQGVSSIVSDQGLHKIIGDEFKPATSADPQRFWSIGRVVDHVEQRLTAAARLFIGSTYHVDRIGIHLTRELNPLIAGGEILGGTVVPDLDHEQNDHKYLIAEIDLLFATNVITVRLNLIV